VAKQPSKLACCLGVTTAIGLLLCCGGAAYFAVYPLNGIRVDRLEADLNKSLPDGSTWEQADAWFTSHGFRAKRIARKGGEEDGRIVGLGAAVPNDTLLDSATIYIQVYFDTEGRLEKRVIKRVVHPFL
jgi:hypothetical protein